MTAPTLPRRLRDHLARLILAGFHDAAARRTLEVVAGIREAVNDPANDRARLAACAAVPFAPRAGGRSCEESWRQHRAVVVARAERARRALAERPFDPPDASLVIALDEAAVLFDARLYFEVHELLEPHWIRADGGDREALQGLIQAAVALHHLAGGNAAGARSVLRHGIAKLRGRRLAGLCLDRFGEALMSCLDGIGAVGRAPSASFDWESVPQFPARTA